MNRKKFLQQTSLAAAATALFPLTSLAGEGSKKKKSFRVGFLTDVHVKPTEISEAGMRRAYKHVNNLPNPPEFIINGGDSIMDAMAADKEKTQAQWDVWHKVINSENKLPIYHVIGNHDHWGWQLKDRSVVSDPLYDKAWVMKEHKMSSAYYSFKKDNWHFIILNSAHENNGGYIAKLDDPQYDWLESELQKNTTDNICIISHIPIVSFCSAMFSEKNEANGDFKVSRALLHTDVRRIKSLFNKHPNIKTCLSGHIHLQDEVTYLGIKYFCNGAVSGNWWNGAFQEFQPAYAMFEFFKDGSVIREMINY